MKLPCLLCLLISAGPVGAFEPSDLSGLDIQMERIAGATTVDGAAFRISIARGPAATQLAGRVRQRWLAQGSQLREATSGGWRLLSRWNGDLPEVLQWRTRDGRAEAILSAQIHLSVQPGSRQPFALPGNCAWGRSIAGGTGANAFVQRSAYCSGMAAAGRSSLRILLRESGWQLLGTGTTMLRAARNGREGLLVIVQGDGDGSYGLVWLDMPAQEGDQR